MFEHFERWNIWRKHNANSWLHKLLVLVGVIKSPTFALTLTKKQTEEIHEAFERSLKIVAHSACEAGRYINTITTNGVTFTDNGDGSITVKGTATLVDEYRETIQRMCNSLCGMFTNLQDTFDEIAKVMNACYEAQVMSPLEYGRYLATRKRKDSYQYVTYRYIKAFQRNLPYHRRCS